MGAVLAQLDEHNDEKPIAFFSKRLSDSQKKYAITKQEMLALVSAIRHFHTYLYGTEFICRVDHHSLLWLHNLKNPQGILARWLEILGSYKFEVVHRPGTQHTNADALSRLTPECTPVSEGVCEDDHDHVRQLNDQLKYVCSKCLSPPVTQMEGYDHLIHKPFKIGDNVLIKKISPTELETK